MSKTINKFSRIIEYLFLPIGYCLALPILILVRLISPWIIIRWACLISTRIGHFAANTELYCCENEVGINTPRKRYVDLFWLYPKSCNEQLKKMWKRSLTILPRLIMHPLDKLNENINYLFPSNGLHDIGCGKFVNGKEIFYPPHSDRDIYNLLDKTDPHINFTPKEEAMGLEGLRKIGLPSEAPFVCLIVRDSAYLNKVSPKNNWAYHDNRNMDINNFVPAVEALADAGMYVIRMGVHVERPIASKHPKVIDYAVNGMRNDFMDIYLGANCSFCISTSTGYDAVPNIFRKPILYLGNIPLDNIRTSSNRFLVSTRHHYSKTLKRNLALKEIFDSGLAYRYEKSFFDSKNVSIVPNSPDEIRDIVIEMKNRLDGSWEPQKNDQDLEKTFWEIFTKNINVNNDINQNHGKINSKFSATFLRNNSWWLD